MATKFNKFLSATAGVLLGATALFGGRAEAIPAADIIFVVDESGSMSGEHAWIAGMVSDLEAALIAAGIGAGVDKNRFGLVGFGSSIHGTGQAAHKHTVGSGDFGTAAEMGTAAAGLVASGGIEDGYDGIDLALDYAFRADVARNIILITDEDRDINGGPDKATIESDLAAAGAILNVVVNHTFTAGEFDSPAIGVDGIGALSNGYVADGSGGFTKELSTSAGSGDGTTFGDYVEISFPTGGAAWDLNILRAGGDDATSFTAAFIDVKVQEIQSQVPEPATATLFGLGIVGLGLLGRRRLMS